MTKRFCFHLHKNAKRVNIRYFCEINQLQNIHRICL